ncbi:MAG: glycosyltransferase family 4 protein [Erythrobacteraceae bacterium]
MTRVAYLVSDYDAPSHTFVRREVAALRALGTDVCAFSIIKSGNSDSEAISVLGRPFLAYFSSLISALIVSPLRFVSTWNLARRHRPPGLRALLWAQFHFVEAIMLAKLLSQAATTNLHVHFANSGATVGMLAANYLRLPWSMTLHGISETDYPAGLLLPEKISKASFVACASYFMQAQAMRHVSSEQWHKFRIIRCGVDYRRLEQIFASSNGSGVPKLICVGRLSPEKGHLGLLEVMRRLREKGIDFTLNLVGDGPSRSVIEALVDSLDLRDRVFFEGFLKEDDTLLTIAASDILVLPSLMEGLPVVLIEALALGKPVVASRVAGIPELIEHGKSGLLFTPSDLVALEDVIAELLKRRDDWCGMGRLGRLRVQHEFDITAIASSMQSLLARGYEQ